MVSWLPFPFVRFSLPWIFGVWLSTTVDLEGPIWPLWWFFSGAFWVLILIIKRIDFPKWSSVLGALALISIFMGAVVRVNLIDHRPQTTIESTDLYWGRVVELIKETPKYLQYEVVIEIHAGGSASGRLNRAIWFQGPKTKDPLRYGDRVLIKGTPNLIRPPANPHQFDYRQFLLRKGVQWQHWISPESIIQVIPAKPTNFYLQVSNLRRHLQSHLKKYLNKGPAQEIASAMLLGNRHKVSQEVRDSFAKSGTIHVLAVSGLHLGIIYGVLVYFLAPWRYHKILRWVLLSSVLISLWTIALITGMAPATRRAAIMFSVLLISKQWKRQGNSFNALALSAVIILIIDPYELYAVGFQLSYLALAGILYLQPLMAKHLKVHHRLLRYFRDLITVSLSAQIAVLPLSVYYFHQIPTYFLLGNVVLIPLTFLIVSTGFIFLSFSFSPAISHSLGKVISFLIETAHQYNRWLASFQGSTIDNLWIKPHQLILIYLLLVLTILLCRYFRRSYLNLFLLTWCVWLAFDFINWKLSISERRLVVYQIKGHTAIDFIQNGHYQAFGSLPDSSLQIMYNVAPNRAMSSLKPATALLPEFNRVGCRAWMFDGKLVLLIHAPIWMERGPNMIVDLVILSDDALVDLNDLPDRLIIQNLVVDGSYSYTVMQRLRSQARARGIPFHSTVLDGALVKY